MSNNVIAGITALLLGFCLMGCVQTMQEHLFGCKQSPNHTYCPERK